MEFAIALPMILAMRSFPGSSLMKLLWLDTTSFWITYEK
jgi:hypothetical protein